MSLRYDAIVIGAGQAGPSLTGRLAAAGMTVALVERHLFGGTCVNTGCTPTKTLIASAAAAQQVRRAAEFGVNVSGLTMDMPAVQRRKDQVVAASRNGLEHWLRGMEGCTVYLGHARFESATEIRVGDELLFAPRIFINVGGRASVPALPGVDRVPYLTNTSLLQLEVLPRHLVVVGGSYVGLEFAQMYRRFGSEVTVVEKSSRLISREDEDVSDAVRDILEGEGVAVRTDAECIRFEPRNNDIGVGVNCHSGDPEILGSHVLLAMGRRPNTDELGLDRAGIVVDKRGFIVVDDELRTSVAGIWALGDCNGRGAFTHTAYNDFEIVAANLLDADSRPDARPRRVSDRISCYALYTDPPLGRVGMSEKDARAAGHSIRIGSRPMARVSRAVEKGDSRGFMKVIVDSDTNAILGAAILGIGGDEAIHGILDTMAAKVPYQSLQRTMHIHPTVSELIPTVLGELKP